MIEFDSITVEFYNTLNNNWFNITYDVMAEPRPRWNMGIMGNTTLDRVGDPEIFTFSLRNGEINDSNLVGLYTIGHPNQLYGWNVGNAVRVKFSYNGTTYYKYYGWIAPDGIVADTGTSGTRTVTVTCVGFMGKAAEHNLDLMAIQSNKTIEQAVQSLVANMTVSPLATDYGTGTNLFPSVFDTVTPGTKALAEMLKLAVSELGYVYTRGNVGIMGDDGQTLVVKGRQDLLDVTSSYTFDNDMLAMDVGYGKGLANRIKTNAYPRETDASYIVMWKLNKAILVPANTTVGPFRGTYRNPTGGSKTMKGSDMQTPVATTDYVGNTASDGSGSSKTADMSVTTTFGATDFEYSIQNTSGVALYTGGAAGKFQVRGKGVYFDDQSTNVVDDATSQTAYGMKELTIDMKYQDDPTLVENYANYYLSVKKDPYKTIESITLNANRDTNNIEAFLNIEPGSRVTVIEDMSAVDDDFYVMGYDAEIIAMRYVIWKPVLVNTLEIDFDLWLNGYTTKEEPFTAADVSGILFQNWGSTGAGTALSAGTVDGRIVWEMKALYDSGASIDPGLTMTYLMPGTSDYRTNMGRLNYVFDHRYEYAGTIACPIEFGLYNSDNNKIVIVGDNTINPNYITYTGRIVTGGTVTNSDTLYQSPIQVWTRGKFVINQLATKVTFYMYDENGTVVANTSVTTTLPGTATALYPWMFYQWNFDFPGLNPPDQDYTICYMDYWAAGYTV